MAEQQGKLNALKEINSRTTAESCRLSQENESVTELLKKFKKEVDERLSKLERKTVELERKTVELEKKTTGLESVKKDHTALVERVTVLENFKKKTEEQIAIAEMATHLFTYVGQQLNVETPVPSSSLPLECNSDYKFQLCSMMP
ncbi:hypothetical protein Pelo_11069 [Pelomyxa schiedti]|nr:hypothetical protein Pelo_11069 [Pelomyxa schiedti]